MVRQHLPRSAGLLACIVFGATLALPVWWRPWLQWQAHRERQNQLHSLAQEVLELSQATAHPATPEAAPPLGAPALRESLQALATQNGLQLTHLEEGLPVWFSNAGGWLCPFQARATGAAAQWVTWWQSVVQQHGGSVLLDLQLQARESGNVHVQLQMRVPCAVVSDRAPTQSADSFSLPAWHALHARRAQSHPSFQALASRWAKPRTPLERFTLDQMRYVGYMHDAQRALALLAVRPTGAEASAAPDQSHTVEVGQAIGAHLGEVMRIDAHSLTVREWWRDGAGVWRSRELVLPLEGGQP